MAARAQLHAAELAAESRPHVLCTVGRQVVGRLLLRKPIPGKVQNARL